MQERLIKYFPMLIFLSTMMMPHLLNFSALSKTFIPIMFLLWLMLIVRQNMLNLPILGIYLLLVLLVGQSVLWLIGELNMWEPMLLGLVWIITAFLILNSMQYINKYTDVILLSFLGVAVIWAILAGIVWFHYTGGGAITIAGIALTHGAHPKPTGPFSNGNVFGIMMLCAWIISIKYALSTDKNRIVFFMLGLFFLVWVFCSTSRGAWLAGGLILSGVLLRLLVEKRWFDLLLLFLSLFLSWSLAGEMVSLANGNNNLVEKAEGILSAGARLVLYPSVFEVWKAHWLLGVGFGNLVGHYLTGQAEALTYLPVELVGLGATASAHNHLLHILAEAGLIGLLLWLGVTILLFKNFILNRFNLNSSAWAPLSIAMVLWIQGLFNLTMTEALPFFLFFMVLGLGVSLQSKPKIRNTIVIPTAYYTTAIFLIFFTLIYYSINTFKTWKLYEKLISTSQGIERGKLVGQLFSLENNNNIYPYAIITVAYDFMATKKGDIQAWGSILPNIDYALSLEEWPHLYQAQFYAYMILENWEKACASGSFIQQQHWPNDTNMGAYNKACLGKKADDFKLGL